MHMDMPVRPLTLWIVYAILVIVPAWRILRRMGYSGWWSVLAVIPGLNVVLLYVIAFARWPIERGAGGSEAGSP